MTLAQKFVAKDMIDDIISRYGFEAKETIDFCKLVEENWDKVIPADIGIAYMELVD